MIIDVSSQIPFPRSLVYATFRDNVVDLVPYVPSIKNLQLKSRVEKPEQVECVYILRGVGEIPSLLKPWLNEDLLTWTEYDVWKASNFTLEWRIRTHAFTEAVHWAGINSFFEQGNTTLVKSRCELKIDHKALKNIPFIMRSQVAQLAEHYLAKQSEPSLSLMSEGVRRYLSQANRQ
ncbi:hypothetical protein [Gloeothece verrucosa]|uniref:Cyclase/dehydrase n=1 Tax=Gloeothece verrucosa (strain PCC 7822) TaxID=497965 RepID=E0UI48_GLOV7|nr:hypothetical protein [Gloeothece verrucosa]ADN15700.1 conserved hypothetical protein [Gloeothece verrucosa PCC 7822]